MTGDQVVDDDPRLSQLDVVALVCAICRRVGLEPNDVGELKLTPTRLTARVYRRNAQGQKFLLDGSPAMETWEVSLRG